MGLSCLAFILLIVVDKRYLVVIGAPLHLALLNTHSFPLTAPLPAHSALQEAKTLSGSDRPLPACLGTRDHNLPQRPGWNVYEQVGNKQITKWSDRLRDKIITRWHQALVT